MMKDDFHNYVIRMLGHEESIPWDLILLADESRQAVEQYIDTCEIFVLEKNEQIIGEYLFQMKSPTEVEIKNIAVQESFQGRGYGTEMIYHAILMAEDIGAKDLYIGTGETGKRQIKLYKKIGFEEHSVIPDFFLKNYPKPIFENGRQCRDMIMFRRSVIPMS